MYQEISATPPLYVPDAVTYILSPTMFSPHLPWAQNQTFLFLSTESQRWEAVVWVRGGGLFDAPPKILSTSRHWPQIMYAVYAMQVCWKHVLSVQRIKPLCATLPTCSGGKIHAIRYSFHYISTETFCSPTHKSHCCFSVPPLLSYIHKMLCILWTNSQNTNWSVNRQRERRGGSASWVNWT